MHDSYKTDVIGTNQWGQPSTFKDSGIVTLDTLANDSSTRNSLQGMINRFSGAMKG